MAEEILPDAFDLYEQCQEARRRASAAAQSLSEQARELGTALSDLTKLEAQFYGPPDAEETVDLDAVGKLAP